MARLPEERNSEPHDERNSEAGSHFTRGTFLRGSAVAVVGAAIGGPGIASAAIRSGDIGQPKRGGTLRVGIRGAGSQSTLNPLIDVGEMDFAQGQAMFERLTDYDPNGRLYNSLAEEFSHNKSGNVWQVKLRKGITWHDGSPFSADDVVYTLKYQLNPNNKTDGYSNLATFLKPSGIRRIDAQTVELRLLKPYALLPGILGVKEMFVIKNGATPDKPSYKPIGTGPFMFKSWTRGQRTVMARNPNYHASELPYLKHASGLPYVDSLEFIEIDDPTANLNALTSGQIDMFAGVDPEQVATVKTNSKLRLLLDRSSATTDFFMLMNSAPFTDVRVRQAFRLMVDRHELVQTVLLGYGVIGNDLHCLTDPDYAREIPQRPYDPQQAMSLLKQAGQESLTVELYTATASAGMLSAATLLQAQAKKVGVTINLKVAPASNYYSGPDFKHIPLECSDWGQHTLDGQIAQSYTCGATWNEPGWCNQKFNTLVEKARHSFDPKVSREYFVDAQKLLWEEGGYIVWGFRDLLDAYSANVQGLVASSQRNLGYYRFEGVSL